MNYFLKSVGFSKNPLPAKWWETRAEITRCIYFSSKPKAIRVGATLIYYAVGGDGRLCGVVEVTGPATQTFTRPDSWTPAMHKKLGWCMPITLIHRCAADKNAPKLAEFQSIRIGSGCL